MDAIDRGIAYLARFTTAEGSVRRENDAPLFLTPGYVFACYATGTAIAPDIRERLAAGIERARNPDGGWPLHFEGESFLFTTVLDYVALRLLGRGRDERALTWIRDHGGTVAIPTWGKCWLAVLGLYEWEGVNALLPELWLLPRWFPLHPRRFWCHTRVIYLVLSYLYGRRWRAPETPLLAELRAELFDSYEDVDWRAARRRVHDGDVYTRPSLLLRTLNRLLNVAETIVPRRLRRRALALAIQHVRYEDETTGFLCLGPVNKALNVVAVHADDPSDDHARRTLEGLHAYLYEGEAGLAMQAYVSSESWDTAFAAKALVASGRVGRHRRLAEDAFRYLEANQVLEEVPAARRYHRGPRRGGWAFANRTHGWTVADCTAEGLGATLALGAELGRTFPHERVLAAVDLLLALQNRDGGWPTYERRRGGRWLEAFNASELFSEIMVDYSYVELTSSAVQALAGAREHVDLGQERLRRIAHALKRGEQHLRRRQRPDGSWEGLWGICFTYGTWFGVWGLRACGAATSDPAIARATEFLLSKQLPDGGWGESYESCLRRAYVHHPEGGQPVMTAWALLALLDADAPQDGIDRGVRFLLDRQLPDGDWPQRSVTGVFNKTCMQNYPCYRSIFPVWALALAERRDVRLRPGHA